MRAMQVLKHIIFNFVMDSIDAESDQEHLDSLLTLLTDMIIEIFEKVRDIYCVLESVIILSDLVIERGLKIKQIRESLFTQNFTTKLI